MWTETVLHSFAGGPQDGGGPRYGPLVFDHAGNMFGTTSSGGASSEGTVYEITHSSGGWMEKILYSFGAPPDAAQPQAAVTLDSAGNLYGTTLVGGRSNVGTVFELTPTGSGWTESILYNFTQDSASYNPIAGVILDGSGNLYGVTNTGPAVYELSPAAGAWTYQVLYALNAFWGPYENLTFDSTGDLLGAVYSGNPHVFRLTLSDGVWTLTGFDGNDGGHSFSNVLQDASGNFYATSSIGGAHSLGTVFQITP